MGLFKDIRVFDGGLDQDSPDELISPNDYRYLLNARNKYGKVVNLKGNEDTKTSGNSVYHEANPSVDSGSKVIYSCDDIENNAIVYFLYNSTSSKNAIYRFWVDTNTIELILKSSYLDFSLTDKVRKAVIIDNKLIWTDNNGFIKSINIDKASDYSLSTYNASITYSFGDFVSYNDYRYRYINNTDTSGNLPTDTTYWVSVRAINAYSTIDKQTLSFIKYPPCIEPETVFCTDSSYSLNYLKDKILQFAYRYVYDDYSKSTVSPYSMVNVPSSEIYVNKQVNYDTTINNRLYLYFYTGHLLVNKIDILVREGNIGDWYLYETINKYDSSGNYKNYASFRGDPLIGQNKIDNISSDDISMLRINMYLNETYFPADTYITEIGVDYVRTNYSATTGAVSVNISITTHENGIIPYSFYNDKQYLSLTQTDIARPFDYVPKKARTLALINKSMLAIGGYTEGFDNDTPSISLSYTTTSISTLPSLMNTDKFSYAYTSTSGGWIMYKYEQYDGVVSEGDILTLSIAISGTSPAGDELDTESYIFPFKVSANDVGGTYPENLFDKIHELVSQHDKYTSYITPSPSSDKRFNVYRIGSYLYVLVNETISQNSTDITIGTSNITLSLFVSSFMPTYKTWKPGKKYFGVVYGDKQGRFGNVNALSVINIPEYADIVTDMYKIIKISWEIESSEQPPDWAYYWKFVYYDNVPTFTQYKFGNSDWRIDDAGNIRIKINKWVQFYNSQSVNSQLSEYVYVEGDMFKLIALIRIQIDNTWAPVDGDVLEGRIIGGENDDDGNYEIIVLNLTGIQDIITDYGSVDYWLGEIYTPKKELTEKLYKEIGKTFKVGNPTLSTRYFKSDESQGAGWADQILGTSEATGIFLTGDSYYGYRQDFICGYPCLRQNMSDFYSSESYDYGRTNYVDEDAKEKTYNNLIRYGGKYVDNTQINKIAKFDYDDYVELNELYGNIEYMEQIGDVFKILQQHKENSSYIGRSVLTSAEVSSRDTIVASNDILGTIIAYEDDYGCQDYRSVVKHNRHLYYLDKSKGVVIRSAPNGQIPISKYKMETWFRDICHTIKGSSSATSIFATFIDDYNEYILVFIDGTDVNAIVFNEDKNRWTHYINLSKTDDSLVEHIAAFGQKMVSFKSGTLYVHEVNDTYNYLFGEQRKEQIQFIVNKGYLSNKIFSYITIHTDNDKYNKSDDTKNWSIPTITIPVSKLYSSGMSSRITAKRMEYKEGNVNSEFLFDLNTPNKSGKNALINGRALRGKVLDITMENKATTEVNLVSVVVGSISSELNSP